MNLRDVIAALLRGCGWGHDDEKDARDLYWCKEGRGTMPMLAALADEMNCRSTVGVVGWDTYKVSVGVPVSY